MVSQRWFFYPPDLEPHFDPNRTTLSWVTETYPHLPEDEAPLECTIKPGEVTMTQFKTSHTWAVSFGNLKGFKKWPTEAEWVCTAWESVRAIVGSQMKVSPRAHLGRKLASESADVLLFVEFTKSLIFVGCDLPECFNTSLLNTVLRLLNSQY